jgi:hypothetical protein
MNEIKLNIKAFRAIDDTDACSRYVEEHMNVLRLFGITMITTANKEWFNDPKTYVIMVMSEDEQKVYGGARVQIAGGEYLLPIEKAVTKFDSNIHKLVNNLSINGTGELCGLWNSREVAGLGIGSIYLGRVGVAIATQLNLKSLFALCAPATVRNCLRVGFQIETSLGNNGTFYYPKEDLVATAVLLKDTTSLLTADPNERDKILDIRSNPITQKNEISPKKQAININYNLLIK